MEIGEPWCFDQVRQSYAVGSASIFGDLRWNVSLAYTSKTWFPWKFLVQLSEMGGNCPLLAARLT